MKQKFIALLRTSFASKGFNAKELESLADLVIAQNLLTDESTDEDLATAVTAAKPMADFVQSVASRQVSDVKKPKVEDPKPAKTEDPAKPAAPAEDMPEWAKALVTSTQALAQGLQAIQIEKVGNTRREQYAKALEGTSEAYKTEALKDFDRLTFKDDDDYSEWLGAKTEAAKVFAQEETNNNLGNERPAGGVGGKPAGTVKEASAAEVDAAVESII